MSAAKSPTPKIELHVHLEGAVRPAALIEIAERNGLTLPTHDAVELAELYRFRDFDHFIELWLMTTSVIRTEVDFRQVVLAYRARRPRTARCTSKASSRPPNACSVARRGTRCSPASATARPKRKPRQVSRCA